MSCSYKGLCLKCGESVDGDQISRERFPAFHKGCGGEVAFHIDIEGALKPREPVFRPEMERGTPELCPVKLRGPYLVITTDPDPNGQIPYVVASVRRELDDWEALWRRQLDKSL